MVSGDDFDAIRFVYIVASLLAILSVYLLFTSVIVRYASRYVEKQRTKRRNQFYTYIIEYITGENESIERMEKSVKAEFDMDLFVEILADMMTQLDGQEVPKIQSLLFLPGIRAHYFAKLKSSANQQRIDACLYYSKVIDINDEELRLLRQYVKSPSPLLAHAAASGLLSSKEVRIRFEALTQVVHNPRISRLALIEIMYRFHTLALDQFEEESECISKLLVDTSIPAHNIGVVIRAITDIGYGQLLMVLYDLLESGFRSEDDEVIDALIYSMGQFQFGPAGDWMIDTTVGHANPRIRKSTAQAFEAFNDVRFLPYLKQLAQDPVLDVRIRAIFAMVAMGPEGQTNLDELAMQTEELQELIGRIRDEMEVV